MFASPFFSNLDIVRCIFSFVITATIASRYASNCFGSYINPGSVMTLSSEEAVEEEVDAVSLAYKVGNSSDNGIVVLLSPSLKLSADLDMFEKMEDFFFIEVMLVLSVALSMLKAMAGS